MTTQLPATPDTVFRPFPKLSRLQRPVIVTEKIDGTNASVFVPEDPDQPVLAGSRTRWITPGKGTDNFGFAEWVSQRADDLREDLGPGHHFGEWWGVGIQRGYGLSERRFSLFNTSRWNADNLPRHCHVVPVLATFESDWLYMLSYDQDPRLWLRTYGSAAAPGFMDPEGIVVFHTHANTAFKFTFDGDGHKSDSH